MLFQCSILLAFSLLGFKVFGWSLPVIWSCPPDIPFENGFSPERIGLVHRSPAKAARPYPGHETPSRPAA